MEGGRTVKFKERDGEEREKTSVCFIPLAPFSLSLSKISTV